MVEQSEKRVSRMNPETHEPEIWCTGCKGWAPNEACYSKEGEYWCEDCIDNHKQGVRRDTNE